MLELEKWEGKIAENEPDIEAMLAGAMRYKIAAARRQTGISLAELSERCSLSVSRLKDLENGREAVTPELLAQILDACHYFAEENAVVRKIFENDLY